MRTGVFSFECLAPTSFEAAVVFKRPRWPRRMTERAAIDHALKRLNAAGQPPQITEGGRRVTCDIREAKVGERYILVVFRKHGIAECERWLKQTSMYGRAHRVLNDWTRALRG
jgi:thioredoxin-related protein